jgi:hypothetical protein
MRDAVLLERLLTYEADARLTSLTDHPAPGGPELTYLQRPTGTSAPASRQMHMRSATER